MTQNVRVRCGVYELELGLAGQAVSALRRSLGVALNIDPGAMAVVNGTPVPETHVVVEGDHVEFIRPAGRKGS